MLTQTSHNEALRSLSRTISTQKMSHNPKNWVRFDRKEYR